MQEEILDDKSLEVEYVEELSPYPTSNSHLTALVIDALIIIGASSITALVLTLYKWWKKKQNKEGDKLFIASKMVG